jgi:hypothetical protein
MIKYRFAYDKNGNLTDINCLERVHLTKDDKYYALENNLELIPRLGLKKRKHFAHKSNTNSIGSRETYLHILGKILFFEKYKKALENNTPFLFSFPITKICDRLESIYGTKCKFDDSHETFNLTNYFTEIKLEKKDGEFIPYLTIMNPNNGNKIFIEIKVTHESTPKKLNSGFRIIEIHLNSDDDIKNVTEFEKGLISENIRLINFKKNVTIKSICKLNNCLKEKFNYFFVTSDGKCYLHSAITEKQLLHAVNQNSVNSIFHIIEPINNIFHYSQWADSELNFYKKYISKAAKSNILVRNCYICRYHAHNISLDYVPGEPIFCKFLKIKCGSNNASKCSYYKMDFSAIEYQEMDE